MMKRIAAICAIALMVMISGCVGLNSMMGPAFITDYSEAKLATSLADASKTGKSCGQNYLGIYVTGDSSIAAAKRNGGITRVSSVDHKIFSVAPFYGEICTIVRGR